MEVNGTKCIRCDEDIIGSGSSFLQRTPLRACWCDCSVNEFFNCVQNSPSGDHRSICDCRGSMFEDDSYTVADGTCVSFAPPTRATMEGTVTRSTHCFDMEDMMPHACVGCARDTAERRQSHEEWRRFCWVLCARAGRR